MANCLSNLVRKILRYAILTGLFALIIPRLLTALHAYTRIFTVQEVPSAPVAIVFGAGLWWDGRPTPVLRDRVTTAVELFQSGKVYQLLLSGSQSGSYNEPEAMRAYAESLGVPTEAILLDISGNRTYDTCYRALEVFGIRSAILVTQSFHLPRALYTCQKLGIEAVGVAADRRNYHHASLMFWNLREFPATLGAVLDIHFLHSRPSFSNYQNQMGDSPMD